MKLAILIATVVIILGGVFAITQGDKASTDKPTLTFKTIQSDMAIGGQLLDVRTPDEYNESHINGAINLPLQDMKVGVMPSAPKEKPLYVYCRSGNRSAESTKILASAGYQNVIDLGAMPYVQSIGGTIKSKE